MTTESKIMMINNRLVYECILCKKFKSIEEVKKFGNGEIFACIDCNKPKEELISELPSIIVIPKLLLPSVEAFNLFMDDILFHKCGVEPLFNDRTLILTTTKSKKSIQINIDALLQILCCKYEHPVIHESYVTQNIDLQTNMQNLYVDIQDRLDHAILKYNKILPFEDKRIKDLCESHATMFIIPLKLKIQYQEWEKSLISGYISSEISKGMAENNKKLSEIQIDYAKKLEEEKVKNNTRLENYSREILRLQGMNESLNSMRSSSKEEINSIKLEKDELYDKYKKLEISLQEKDTEVIKLKFDSEKVKKELEKHKIVDEWMLDPTSTSESPTYFNQVTKEYVTYPVSFKEKYKPDSMDNDKDVNIYKEINGDKTFELPRSLMRFVKTTEMMIGNNISNGETTKLKENTIKIINVLSRDKENALTRKEICEKTNIKASHVGEYIKEGTKANKIIMFEDKEGDERFYRL